MLDLNSVGVKIEEEDQTIILLSSLPKVYKHFVDTMLYGKETLTMAQVKSALNTKELQRKADQPESSHGDGLTAKGRSQKRDNKSSRNKSSPNQEMERDVFVATKRVTSRETVLNGKQRRQTNLIRRLY